MKLTDIAKSYRESAALLVRQEKRCKKLLENCGGDAAAVLRSELSRICEVRRDLRRMADYLEEYYEKCYCYEKKTAYFYDHECYFARRSASRKREL